MKKEIIVTKNIRGFDVSLNVRLKKKKIEKAINAVDGVNAVYCSNYLVAVRVSECFNKDTVQTNVVILLTKMLDLSDAVYTKKDVEKPEYSHTCVIKAVADFIYDDGSVEVGSRLVVESEHSATIKSIDDVVVYNSKDATVMSGKAFLQNIEDSEREDKQVMNIYMLRRNTLPLPYSYDSCIVAANSEEEAKSVHPNRRIMKWKRTDDWVTKDNITVTLIGTSVEYCRPRPHVVLSSFIGR